MQCDNFVPYYYATSLCHVNIYVMDSGTELIGAVEPLLSGITLVQIVYLPINQGYPN